MWESHYVYIKDRVPSLPPCASTYIHIIRKKNVYHSSAGRLTKHWFTTDALIPMLKIWVHQKIPNTFIRKILNLEYNLRNIAICDSDYLNTEILL